MHAEVTVDDPDLAAALALLAAVVVIDLAAIRSRRATVSRFCAWAYRTWPKTSAASTGMLLLHLLGVMPGDPLRLAAGKLGQRLCRVGVDPVYRWLDEHPEES